MSCTKEDGKSCTMCCEAIGLTPNNKGAVQFKRRKIISNITDSDKYLKLLVPISKRRAKKRNRHAVKVFPSNTFWFTCRNLKVGVGCTDYENRPDMCVSFGGTGSTYDEYSPTCNSDINRKNVFFKE